MSKLQTAFTRAGRKALVAYVTVGYPDIDTTLRLVPLLAESGCDVVELGIPFSDPLADGLTIQHASHVALENGVTPAVCLDVAAKLSHITDLPLLFMTYYNLVLHRGLDAFCSGCAGAGVSGLIVPDLPPDEGLALEEAGRRTDLDLIYLVAPTTTDERLRHAAARSRGFLYMVSLTGVTGARSELDGGLESFVARARAVTTLPLCVGFGISSPSQAARVAGVADGAIVGSRILQLVDEDRALGAVAEFVRELRLAVDSVG